MKKLLLILVFFLGAFTINAETNTDFSNQVGGYFYTSLSPYGTWIEIGLGTPVWRPTIMKKSWSPYYHGQWVYTDYGWYWNSYEPFGEIVYHYGRWYYDDYYGWIWIPDYEWAPAWVEWRYDDDYIGWAPLSPYATFSISVGIHYNYDYYVSYSHWNFVKYNHFCDNNIYRYYVSPKYKYRVYTRTKVQTNYDYYNGRIRNEGVGFDRIRERSGRTILKRNIVTVNDPAQIPRDRNISSRDKEVRTYIASREDISQDGLRDIKVTRNDRKSSLDISKVGLSRDRDVNKTNQRNENTSTIRNDRNSNSNVDRQTTKNKNEVTRQNENNEKVNKERNDSQNRNSELNKRNNEQSNRNNNSTIQKREERNNKNTQRNQSYNNDRTRNSEVRKNESNIRNQKRDDLNNTEQRTKTRSR